LDYKKEIMSNGLRILFVPMKETRATSIIIGVGAGSRYEEKRTNGLAHFAEHLFFKGTRKRSNSKAITIEIDRLGGTINAFTGEEITGFWVQVPSSKEIIGLDVLLDLVTAPLFREQDIEKERGVIIEELNMYQDDPRDVVANLAKKLVYGDTPLGRKIIGEKETVKRIVKKDFTKYLKDFYTPDNIVVSIAGNFEETKLKKYINNYFKNRKSKKARFFKKIKEAQKVPNFALQFKETDQAHIILTFRTIKRTDPKRFIQEILALILGGNMSSRLFVNIRDRLGIAYYISSSIDPFADCGALSVAAGFDLQRIELGLRATLREFEKLKSKKITEAELKRAKDCLIGSTELLLESSKAVSRFFLEQELLEEKIRIPEKLYEELRKVSVSDIYNFANKYFVPRGLNLAVVGPFKETNVFDNILNNALK